MAKAVVDANRLFSALLRDGASRAAILASKTKLVAPIFLLEEIRKYVPEIARRSGKSPAQVAELVELLRPQIQWIPTEALRPFAAAARKAMRGADPKDVAYVACALATGADAIWSFDLDFDRQNLVPRVPHPDAIGTSP